MKVKRKPCSVESCTGIVFARGLCRYHYRISYSKAIAKSSRKRQRQLNRYTTTREEFIEQSRDKHGKIYCIFCGKEIYGEPDLHHSLGRDDELLLDTRFWFLAHNNCHVHEYHSRSCLDISWWSEYIERLKELCILRPDIKLVMKIELIRQEKAYENNKKRDNGIT